jgi:hypothetical protein
LLIISSLAVLPSSDTDLLAKTPQPSADEQVTQPLDVADAIYSANTSIFLGSKNISLTPYRMTEGHYSDQGFLKGVGNITDNQTFVDTHLSDKLLQGIGNGTFETPDGQSIAWISSGIGRSVDDRWVYYDLMLFNNTQSKSLSILNNSISLAISIGGNGTDCNRFTSCADHIWLLE